MLTIGKSNTDPRTVANGWLVDVPYPETNSIGGGLMRLIPSRVTTRKINGGVTKVISGLILADNKRYVPMKVHVFEHVAKAAMGKIRRGKPIMCLVSISIIPKRIFHNGAPLLDNNGDARLVRDTMYVMLNGKIEK